MKKKLSVKQNGFKDCASACLLSIIRYYGGNLSQEEISYLICTDAYGTNAYNLIEGAKKIGFDGYGIKINFKNLLTKNDFPVIAHIKFSNMYHYVVIYQITKKYFKIMDPVCGMKKVSYKEFESIYLGTILYLYPIKNIPKITTKDKILKQLIKNVFIKKAIIIRIAILSIIITLLSIILNLYLKIYIDYIHAKYSLNLLLTISTCFLMVIFLKSIFEKIRSKILINIKSDVSYNITTDAINHVMSLPYCYFKNKPSGEIISRIDDMDNFKELVSNVLLNSFVNVFLIIASIFILLFVNNILFLISIVIIIFYFLTALIYSKIFENQILDLQTFQGEYRKDFIELISGYESFKNLNVINNFICKIKEKFNILLKKTNRFEYSYTNQNILKNIIEEVGLILIATMGLIMIKNNIMTIGDLVAFLSLVLFFIEPIKGLLDLLPNIKYAFNSYNRINELLMIEKENENNMDKTKIDGEIKISDLCYSYNNIAYIFENISLKIKKGDKFLIYGTSGNGKSTLIKILMKYIDNYKGEIYINNINLKDLKKETIRNSITYVSQHEVLLNDTIKNNIILNRNISEKYYNEIIRLCKVDKILNSKSMRNNFLLEEDGFNLSGGERQKIILARGLLKNSNIIILDEALSEVDFEEEKEIIKEIFKKYEKNTIIYVSHKSEIKDLFKYNYRFLKKGEINANK